MKFLIAFLTVLATAHLFADTRNIRPSWSGSWFNPDQSGHGISVEVLDDERTLIYWLTYDLEGNPIWLIALGENSEVTVTGLFIPAIHVEATAYYIEGMNFGEFDPSGKIQQEWGTIVLNFIYAECHRAHMEWFPTMAGFTHGSTDLVRLTSLYELNCVEPQGLDGSWEVQFGYDAELKYTVEVVATPNPEEPELKDLFFEFLDRDDCLWSGELFPGWGLLSAEWSNQCGAGSADHSGGGRIYFEHKLCDSDNECVRKNEAMIFEDEGEYLIFSR